MKEQWQRIVDWLAFTAAERKVVYFLVGALLLGFGIRWVRSQQQPPAFDYNKSDSTFTALSNAIKQDTIGLSNHGTQGKLNINTATDMQLETLPGIGPVLAERIIQYRSANGSLRSPDELLKIKGITKKRLEQIKDFITIE